MERTNKLHILTGTLFDYLGGKDLIVNSNNKYMLYGSGICGQIYKRAGMRELEDYCQKKFTKNMEVNEIRFTPGFGLNVDILHIYCPKFFESTNPYVELLDSYYLIFNSAAQKGYKNIISVSLGTGHHGYKHECVGSKVYEKLRELVEEFDVEFYLVLPDEKASMCYVSREET